MNETIEEDSKVYLIKQQIANEYITARLTEIANDLHINVETIRALRIKNNILVGIVVIQLLAVSIWFLVQ